MRNTEYFTVEKQKMSLKNKHDLSNMAANKKKDILRMLTHQVTRGWVLILGQSLELFLRQLAVSGAATRDKHGVPDGKLLERNKIAITHLSHAMEPQSIYHLIDKDKVAEEHILRKYCNCNSFGVAMDLLNSKTVKVAITQLSNAQQL